MRSSNVRTHGVALILLLLTSGCVTASDTAAIDRDVCDQSPSLGSHIPQKSCPGGTAGPRSRESLNSWELQRSEQTQERPEN